MDTYEATKAVMSRIQTLDPDNASKIMGYILIQDQGDKEMIRLAFGPEPLLLSYINKAKACLGIITPSSQNHPFPQSSSPRILIPNNGFHFSSNPSSPASAFHRTSPRPFSYAAAVNPSSSPRTNNSDLNSNGSMGSSSLHFYGGGGSGAHQNQQVQDQFSFLDEDPMMSPSGRSDSLVFPYGEDANGVPSPHATFHHRRSCSVNDAAFLEEGVNGGAGFGWRPCMYFARGFCKNGSSCKFLHSDVEAIEVGSPSKNGSGFDELIRLKALQQQRIALMASAAQHPLANYSKCMDFLNENPRSAAAALMMDDEFQKFNRYDRSEFSPLGLVSGANSSSRQIYLTFPADSTFKEDDVSNYFSMFGPVQDVRIPYQQKRMFGFVTFVYAETVKLILAKGNPHFVCDSRVLVKPYKEKGKVSEKKQHLERGEYSSCLSPSGIDSRDHIDLPFGSRMLFNTQEMMLRRKIEQEAELQHAIELQGRRMMNLQLMDLKHQQHNHHLLSNFRAISSPRQSQFLMNQNLTSVSDSINQEDSEEFNSSQELAKSSIVADQQKIVPEGTESSSTNNKLHHVNGDDSNFSESLEHILPDNLFASPTKVVAEKQSFFSQASSMASTDDNTPVTTMTSSNNNAPLLSSSSPLTMASLKSCCTQIPKFSSGQEAIEM